MKCNYVITIDGKRKQFNSEQELDCFLAANFKDIVKRNNLENIESDITMHSNPVQATEEKVNEISKKIKKVEVAHKVINEDGDVEVEYTSIPNSIGTTRFITSYGTPEDFQTSMIDPLHEKPSYLVKPFDEEEYLNKLRAKLTTEGKTKSEIDKFIKSMKDTWIQLTDYGTEIHNLFESIINNKEFTSKYLTEKQVRQLTNEFSDWINELKQKYGKTAKFLTEVPIISDKINEVYKKAGIDSINGRIDLLVIDENGAAHIFDFKVSRKEIGPWNEMNNSFLKKYWHSTKKLAAGYQLAMYKAILNQYGITVKSTGIIPVKLDIEYNEDETIKELETAYMDKTHNINKPYSANSWTNVSMIIPTETLMDDIDLVQSIQEPMTKFVPNYALNTKIQRSTVTVEKYKNDSNRKHIISEEDPDRKFGKYWIWNKYKKRHKIYCKTDEELDKALKELVDDENKYRGNELSELADIIQMFIEEGTSMDEFSLDNTKKSDYCKRIFRKYIEGEWKFHNNPAFVDAGIFVFTKNGLLEAISLHHNPAHSVVNLGKGKSLLGATKEDYEIDFHKTLYATNGNIDLIKVMSLLNTIPEKIKNYKINKISSFNIWMQEGTEVYPETLYDNFSDLCRIYGVPLNLNFSDFATTLESTVNTILETCGDNLMTNIGSWSFTFSPNDVVEGSNFIRQKMEELKVLTTADKLREALRTNEWDFDDPLQLAYMMLGRALNHLTGDKIYIEKDPAKWLNFTREGWYSGININSAGNSPSLNLQGLGKIFSIAETHIRRKELSFKPKISKIIKAFYEYNQRSRLIGGEVKYFDNLFLKDENGNIDKSFKLKKPTDNSLSKEESDFIRMFLEIVNNFKYNGNPDKIAEAIDSEEYYEVPLALGSTNTQIHNKGFKQAIKSKFDEELNFLRLLPEQESEFEKFKQDKKIYNKYKISEYTRNKIIEKNGINGLETQLENLLLDVIHAYSAEEVMNEYLPKLQGIKIALQYQQSMFGVVTKNTVEYIDKFIDINAYGNPIMAKELQGAYKCLSTIKSITTATALGLNVRSGIREMMQGMWIHLSRTMANAYGRDQFTRGDVAKAWKLIFKDSIKDANVLTLMDALNVEYGMANADPHQVKEQLSSSKSGIKNFDSDTLYVFNRVPDTYHRLGLLIAKMIHEGCWEAHEIKNDQLVYNFKKDNRFSLLNDSKSDKNSLEYKKQHALYITMLEQFNKEGWNLKDGDNLPRAYTIQEATSIKSFAEMCFGHYDRSTQMLMKHMFLGAMILQFRTFLSAKMEQWFLKPGTYDQGQYKEKFNENGVRYVRIFEFDEKGIPSVRIDLETNLKEGDKWEPLVEWQGRFMEGMAYSIFSFGKALAHMDFNQMRALWKNDTKRANFYLFLHDMIWMSILMWIVKALWLSDEDLTPMGHMIGTSIYTSFSDGPIHEIAQSMLGDLNPPTYRIVGNLFQQVSGVISGNTNVLDAATNSFGALNDLKYVGEQLA